MEVFRLSQEKHAGALTASGSPARWNLKDEFVLYTSASRSLASLELVVRRGSIKLKVPYKIMVCSIPDDPNLVEEIKISQLNKDWRKIAGYPDLQALGSQWYNRKHKLVLKVPSAVIPKEFNYIINTKHPDFAKVVHVRNEAYFWDDRLI